MSRRERSHGHLHVVADPGTPVEAPKPAAGRAPKNGRKNPPAKQPVPEPDFGLFPMDEIAPPDPADAPDVPIEDVLRQLEALGLPPDLVAQTRALDDEHRAELAGMLNAATAMLTGDPLAGLIGIWKPLLSKRMTAFDAEMATAEILWNLDAATGDDDLVDGLTQVIDEAEHTGRPEALVMCRMLAHLGPPEVRGRANRAANVMAAGGVKDRPWVSSLGTVTFHRAYGFTDQGGRAVVVEFAYGRRHHAFVFLLDEEEGGVVGLYASDDADELYRQMTLEALDHTCALSALSAAEAAGVIRYALDLPFYPEDEEEEAVMEGVVPLLLERLRHLPQGDAPPSANDLPAYPVDDDWPPRGMSVSDFGPPPQARAKVVHRIKVTLAGTKPPVWRRLEVPSDMSLLSLHDVLQMSFGWDDTHLWRFTAAQQVYGIGEIGVPHRNAKGVTIGEIAASKGSAFEYLYDFGDEWRHRIRVEDVGPGNPEVGYPRCLTGRSAAPQEDSDGYDDEDDEPFDVDILNDRLAAFAARRGRR